MNELEKALKAILYGSVGAVATAVESAGKLTQSFVEKGEKVVAEGQTIAEKIGKKISEACENAVKKTGVDIAQLTREQRDELARQLKQMADAEDEAEIVEDVVNEIKEAVKTEIEVESADDDDQKPEA